MIESTPVVFVHGLWMHAVSWRPWARLFSQRGYRPIVEGWPGEAESVEATRRHPEAVADRGIDEITDHYAAIICELPVAPVAVGHSFGGLIVQRLLAQGFARAAVALAPAQFRGVFTVPPTQLAAAWPVLSRPWRWHGTWSHSTGSFHRGFANGVSREESDRLLSEAGIPAPNRPLFQAALANLTPRSPASVDTRTERGPLLLVAAGLDRTVPPAGVRAAYRRQRRSPGITELAVFDDRGHSLAADSGWREVADCALEFLARHDRHGRTVGDPPADPSRV